MPDPALPILQTEIDRALRERSPLYQLAYDFIKIAALAAVIIVPIKYFVAQPFVVEGASMVPALQASDYLVIDELTYLTHKPQRGDVVVFRYPLDPSLYFIKRLVGVPGDTVEVRKGAVWIKTNDDRAAHQLNEPYVAPGNGSVDDASITLGNDEYFMLGDNRKASFDSRVWGPVPGRNIIGRALVRLFPLARAQTLSVEYHQ